MLDFLTDLWYWITGRGFHANVLSWTASTTPDVTYTVFRWYGDVPIARIASGLTATTYRDSAVAAGTAYTYEVQAVDSVGIGSKLAGPITLVAK